MRSARTSVIGIIAVVALAAGVLAGCSSSSAGTADPGTTAPAGNARGSLTLVVAGTDATLAADRVTVTDADRVTWITDRPERDAGSITVADLAARWDAFGFGATPPNAVLTGTSPIGLPRSIPVVISSPTVDGSTVSFRASFLGTTPAGLPVRIGSASLVIDGTGSSASGAETAALVEEATDALNQELQRITDAQANLQSDWSNIGLDIAMKVTLDGDFATATGALQTAITQLPELVDPTRAKIDAVLAGADAAVATLQDQIQTVLTELDAAEAAALAAALALAL